MRIPQGAGGHGAREAAGNEGLREDPERAEDLLSYLEWERSPEKADGPGGPPVDDPSVMDRLGNHLGRFADTLDPEEAREFGSLLRRAAPEDGPRDLRLLSSEEILSPPERAVLRELEAEAPPPVSGLRAGIHVIVKLTRRCNLRCTYCNAWRDDSPPMSFAILARMTRDILWDPGVRDATFTWHGGEPTLQPLDFYRKWLWLQERWRRPDQRIRNRMQTNAVNLSEEWIAFIRRHAVDVGVSLDGPPELNDRRRVTRGGRPTAARSRAGIEALQSAGIEPSILMVIDQDTVTFGAGRILDYLLDVGVACVGLLNVVPENTRPGEPMTNAYLPYPVFVQFLRDLFQIWWPSHVSRINLRELADLVRQVAGRSGLICSFVGDCFGLVYTVEPNGDYSCACDRYFGSDDSLRFGNILETPINGVERSEWYRNLVLSNRVLVDRRRECRWFEICHGGCPHDYKMSMQWLHGFDGACCGLGSLLDDIAGALEGAGIPVPVNGAKSQP